MAGGGESINEKNLKSEIETLEGDTQDVIDFLDQRKESQE